MAMPSPVAIAGLVVSRNTWPAPPVAISVRGASASATRAVPIEEQGADALATASITSDSASASSQHA